MSGQTTAARTEVAAFDVDGTLTTRDCVGRFLLRVGGVRAIAAAVARRPGATLRAVARRDRDLLKEVVVGGVLRGRRIADVREAGERFAREVEASLLRPDTLARLRWHQSQGHTTVLVSASLEPYLGPLARSLGVDHVVCTSVGAASADGGDRYGHLLDGGNCRAAVKASRLRALLEREGLAGATVWAYGDSRGDEQLLAMADHPVWVREGTIPAVPGATS